MKIKAITSYGYVVEENGKLKLNPFSRDPYETGKIKYLIEKGDEKTIKNIIEKTDTQKLVTYNVQMYNALRKQGVNVELKNRKEFNILDLLKNSGLDKPDEYLSKVLESYTLERLKDEMTNKDMLIIHAINSYDEYTEAINIFYERLREWYGIYFPELAKYIKKIDRYASLIHDFLTRDKFTKENLIDRGYSEEKAAQIEEAAKNSTGGMLTLEDLEIIRMHAHTLLKLIEQRDEIDKYLQNLLKEEAPNITHLIGHKLAARLIAKAGGLRKLATLPASTIQLLGAEKSLFIALRRGGKPPKHGVIFQHPFINQSPRVIRGRVARLLAGKIAIAVRVDAFGGDFIADKLLRDIEERVKELRRKADEIKKKKMAKLKRRKKRRRRR